MSKTLIKYFLISVILLVSSCSERITGVKEGNLPPDTFLTLYPDSGSSISRQKSQLRVHWWGDDPDGFVIGFLFSWDGKNWSFTKSNDSIFALKITGLDTNYLFQVSAIDNHGNGKYDDAIIVNGINFGAEPFTDLNGNKKWDTGEEFIDLGLIDPTPAKLIYPIKNSIPVVGFQQNSAVPETTFTVASFAWSVSDIDGDETIDKVLVSLNDTLNFVELPGNTRFITIRAKAPFSSDVVNADIFIGSSVTTPYAVKLPNLKLNSKNVFYLKARDIAGSYSKTIQMPDTNKTWYVKKQKGNILIIDDYGITDNASSFYNLII
ncbi:MAG: fibronectin type III domain-containing protein, partial [Ignavibacteria bacterium]|nr:fibronectin type III domain-containing protein [Ignavibacteria bacterium]